MSFKSVQKKIAGEGHSMASAGAILANASRHASPAAKRANPKLKRVKGKMHEGGVIPEDGAYEMEKGEVVTPSAHKMVESDGVKVPASTETEQKPLEETVSAAPQHGNVICAHPTVDGGECGVGQWEGDADKIHFVKS